MRRAVVDPGVLVSAIITPVGPPAEIVRALVQGRLVLVACPHLLAELLGVLRREKFRRYVALDEVERYVEGLAGLAETVPDPQNIAPVTRDPDDDYLVALARNAGVDALVSGDGDLLALGLTEPKVLSPRTLADTLAQKAD